MSLLEAQDVSKAFGGIQALNTCSISVEQGSITGLIGPNGSGKTTLFNVMTGYERIDAGQVRLDRKSTRLNSSHSQISYAVFCLKKKKNDIAICVLLNECAPVCACTV